MKYLLVLLLFLPTLCFSQNDSTAPRTKLEANAIKVGTIIKKKYDDLYEFKAKGFALYNLGGNGNLNCKILTLKDVASGATLKGLYLSTVYSGPLSQTYTGYIDADEINGLIKFLDFLNANKESQEEEGTEYQYTCNDVRFVAFNEKDKRKGIVWNYRVRVDKYYSGSSVGMTINDLNELAQKLKENISRF